MMSAPLLGPDRLIGTITVQSTATNAFDAGDAELLKLLADQAAIALTNARLYAEVEESERRYRHLVDNSPDIVWSVDVDGNITYFSDSLESRSGWKPEQIDRAALRGPGSARSSRRRPRRGRPCASGPRRSIACGPTCRCRTAASPGRGRHDRHDRRRQVRRRPRIGP